MAKPVKQSRKGQTKGSATTNAVPDNLKAHTFKPGNPGGPGNPYVSKIAALKVALYEAVDTGDLHKIIRKHVKKAIEGDVASAHLILDRCFGKPKEFVELSVGFAGILAEVKSMAEAARMTEEVVVTSEPKILPETTNGHGSLNGNGQGAVGRAGKAV